MALDLSPLDQASRLLLEVPLRPLQGRRFQPTGFPDLGPATYEAPEATNGDARAIPCLLVESAQSMANRLEATIWDEARGGLADDVQGLSYVSVSNGNGESLTSSIMEAHRLNSAYIEKADGGDFHKRLKEELAVNPKAPIDRRDFARTLLKYDINSLLHGVFLESIDGRLRIPRSISAFIEAEDVSPVASGGVKNDRVMPGTEKAGEQTAKEGFGNVPFHREEFVAGSIKAYFNVDLAQIRGYGLGDKAERLLILLALYKIRRLLDDDLRLRTACEFEVDSDAEHPLRARRPVGFDLPEQNELANALRQAVDACSDQFSGEDGVTTVSFKAK